MTDSPSYFTKIEVMAGAGSYGSGPTPEAAIKNCVKNLKADFGKLFNLKSARPSVSIYKIGAGRYAAWNINGHSGVFEVDKETDRIEAYAEIDRIMGNLNLFDLTDYTPTDPAAGYMGGAEGVAKLRQMNADRVAPIGEKVPA